MKEIFQHFIDRTVRQLSLDKRFCGLAIGGSWITKELDEFSDLDLLVVANNEDYPSVINDRFEITRTLGAHVSSFTGEHVGEPRLLICLFRDPLIHVDIKFVALKDFGDRIENPCIAWEVGGKLSEIFNQTSPQALQPDPQWIEDRFWTWVHCGAAKIGRGEIFEAINFLGFLRERVLGPLALWINDKPVRGVRRIEQYLPEFGHKLQKTVPSYNKHSCYEALFATVELYRELRSQFTLDGFTTNNIAERESTDYLLKMSAATYP